MSQENGAAGVQTMLDGKSEKPGLRRNYLHLPELVAQSIGLVGVSGGIGILIPAVFATAGNGTWLAYAFATITLLFASWSISLFARSTDSPGSLYTYVSTGIGPIWGVVCGWSLLIAYAIGAAGILQGVVNTVLLVAREAGLAGAATPLWSTMLLTAAIAFVAWYITCRDIRLSTRFTLLIELLTILLIVAVIAGAFFTSKQVVDHAQWSLENVKLDQMRLGMVLAFFSFVGFESATVLGAEAKTPFKAIPRAVVISIVGPAILFIVASYGLVGAFHGAHPPLDQADGPLSIIARRLGFGDFGVLIDAGVALSFFAAFFSSINAGARIVYTFARQGLFHSATGRAHVVHATPYVAVTLLVVLALLVDLLFTFNGIALLDSYGYLSSIATYGFMLAYMLVAIGAPLYLHRFGKLKGRHVFISAITVILLAIPLIGSVYPVQQGVYAWLPYVFVGLVSAGVLWFLALRWAAPARLTAGEPSRPSR